MVEPFIADAPAELSTMPDGDLRFPGWLAWTVALFGSAAAALVPFAGLWVGL